MSKLAHTIHMNILHKAEYILDDFMKLSKESCAFYI